MVTAIRVEFRYRLNQNGAGYASRQRILTIRTIFLYLVQRARTLQMPNSIQFQISPGG